MINKTQNLNDILNNQLFQMGNIVYYLFDKPIFAIKNKNMILPKFPLNSDWWINKGLENKTIKIVSRLQKNHKEIINYAKIRCKENTILILPLDKDPLFKYIFNNEICWNKTIDLLFIYISCEEICINSQKIMHDPSLFIDIDKNKIGVMYPIPKPPEDYENNYILKFNNGKIKWVKENSF